MERGSVSDRPSMTDGGGMMGYWCGVNRAGCGACVCASRPAAVAQSAKQRVQRAWQPHLLLYGRYGRYLVGVRLQQITRIRHIH